MEALQRYVYNVVPQADKLHVFSSIYIHVLIILLQRIRERLITDFGVIESLCPDPRLISDSCDPSMLGGCKGEARDMMTISQYCVNPFALTTITNELKWPFPLCQCRLCFGVS